MSDQSAVFGPGSHPSFHEELDAQKKRAKQLRWDTYFLGLAIFVSTKSKDESTKCGCVLVGEGNDPICTGYNGMPPGVDDDKPERHERPKKYLFFEHSERNAIYFAALHGKKTQGCTAYVTATPCADCARAFIVAGIKRVVIPKHHNMKSKETGDRWKASVAAAEEMFREAGVGYEAVDIDVEGIGHDFLDYTRRYVTMSGVNDDDD